MRKARHLQKEINRKEQEKLENEEKLKKQQSFNISKIEQAKKVTRL